MSTASPLDTLLAGFGLNPASPHPPAAQKALLVARHLQERARELQTPAERRQQAELDRMLQTPSDKATLALMTDQVARNNRAFNSTTNHLILVNRLTIKPLTAVIGGIRSVRKVSRLGRTQSPYDPSRMANDRFVAVASPVGVGQKRTVVLHSASLRSN
jgi:hypothetical protein